jgi:hypothetical protein
MEAIPAELRDTALVARGRLADLSMAAAAAPLRSSSVNLQTAMAAAASEAIFADALLSAMRSRLEELRTAAK